MLYTNLERSKNPIERRSILLRINENRYRGNENKLNRQKILYTIIPYIFDDEFQVALDAGKVSDNIFELQTRFNYWIGQFEASHGDIVAFYQMFEEEKAQRLDIINKFLNIIINKNKIVET